MTETKTEYKKKLGSGFVITCTLEMWGKQFINTHIEGSADLVDGVVQDWIVDTIVVCDHCLIRLDPLTVIIVRDENSEAIREAIQRFFER